MIGRESYNGFNKINRDIKIKGEKFGFQIGSRKKDEDLKGTNLKKKNIYKIDQSKIFQQKNTK